MSTYALLVGIEKYDHPEWDVAGPCANAIAVAQWLLSLETPPGNIHAFLDPTQELRLRDEIATLRLKDEIATLRQKGVQVRCPADWPTIDTFSRAQLLADAPANSRLLVYWSGHGCTSSTGSRIFYCRDYTKRLSNRVFNGSNFLRRLRSPDFRRFTDQILLFDVCGVYSQSRFAESTETDERQVAIHQLAYFATPEGQYAKGPNGRGVFTDTALKVLQQAGGWPDHQLFAPCFEEALKKVGQTPFRVCGLRDEAELPEVVIGSLDDSPGNIYFQSVIKLLSELDIVSRVFLPHYLRTVTDLGIPALASAQGLVGIVKELSSLRDADLGKTIPYGLLQFLIRLAQEEALAKPINDWLGSNAGAQKNTLAEIRDKLALEAEQKILIILVDANEKGDIASYRPYLRNSDFSPVPERTFEKRAIRSWQAFEQSLQELFAEFMVEGRVSNLEIQFLADPPLFDRPFHRIALVPGGRTTIGEEVVVVLRHRRRVLSSDRRLRGAWNHYANSLRPARPVDLQWIKIAAGGNALPSEKGPCFASFILPPVHEGGDIYEPEKRLLSRLLDLGAPYLYLPHALPEGADWHAVEEQLMELLIEVPTLEGFPMKFTTERIRGNDLAAQATILWDDPLSNPFTSTEGVSSNEELESLPR